MSTETIPSGESTATKITQIHYIVFWIGQILSLFGSSVVGFSVFIFFADMTEGFDNQGTLFTTVSAVIAIPFTIILFVSGPLVDRYNRKKIIIFADGA